MKQKNFPNLITNSATFEQAEKILKNKSVLNENYVDLKPLNNITSEDLNGEKESWEVKFNNFLNEAGSKALNPIVNDKVEEELNDKDGDEKIKAEEKETAKEVVNTQERNYDYSPKVDNINNVNAQEMLNGVYFEIKNNPELSLEEAQEKVIKNLAKDALHYVKEGQFGVEGLGYQEQKVEENTGKTYGGSGYSDKVKEGKADMVPVKESKLISLIKESLGGVITTGNPNSLAAMSGEIMREMMAEVNQEEDLPMDEAKKDHDGDGDVDSDDYLAARGKAIKAAKAKKKVKKESIDTKLSEIGKEAEAVKLEAQLDYLHEYIQEKVDRINSINEDENLQELIDKSKVKAMQKEIKILEKKKAKMEKMYEKMCGKAYKKEEVIDETESLDNE